MADKLTPKQRARMEELAEKLSMTTPGFFDVSDGNAEPPQFDQGIYTACIQAYAQAIADLEDEAAGEFDGASAKIYAIQTCNNNPSMKFDAASIIGGARWQYQQSHALIAKLQSEVTKLKNKAAATEIKKWSSEDYEAELTGLREENGKYANTLKEISECGFDFPDLMVTLASKALEAKDEQG